MNYALVILCGGLSKRMGFDKTFLPFGDCSLLQYQVKRYSPYFQNIYLSVPAYRNRPVDYQAICGCRAIEDMVENYGPIGGLYSCFQNTEEDILFFTSVDAPFTDPALAKEICEALIDQPEADVCGIQDPEGRTQPLFTAYSRRILPWLEHALEDNNYRLRAMLRRVNVHILDRFLPTDQFFNMNDPATYYYALNKLSQKLPGAFPADFATAQPKQPTSIPSLSFVAKSGTGKTTYLEKLLPLLKKELLRIAVVKHDAHGFEIDKPGKDSYRLTQAGADHMILTSKDKTAVIFSHKEQNPELSFILKHIENVDLIITEGYKLGDQQKIHILRKGHCEAPIVSTENIIAYVTDFPYEADVPVFDLNRPEDIVPFLLTRFRPDL